MAEILLYGVIGDEFDKLDAKTIAPLIRAASGPLTLRINSPGGYVMEGLAIVAAIRDYRGKITAYVDGLAASMASVIAAACDECVMAEASMLMIHNPWDVAVGDAPELRAAADKLDRIRDQLVGIYGKRSGIPADELLAMLAAETWMDATQAVERGFADRLAPDLKIAAMANVSAFGFRHPPEQLKETTVTLPSNDTAQAVATERTRISTIMALGGKHRIPDTITQDLITRGLPLDQARAALLDHLASEGDRANIGHQLHGGQTFDNPDFHGKAVGDAIYARLSGKAPEGAARELMSVSVVDMARELLDKQGVRNAIRMRPADVLHPNNWRAPGQRSGPMSAITTTTSDFPSLLQGAGERFLLDKYAAAASVLKQIVRVRSVPDFRTVTGVQMGGFGVLENVNEAGEFKNGSFTDRAESYKVSTVGKIFNLSRQSLINDDLGAFSDVLAIMGRAAGETEAVYIAALITANPTMQDGQAVFSTQHGNLAAAGAAPAASSFSEARKTMRMQKDLDGQTPLNIVPRYIVAGAEQETPIEMALATINPADSESVNPFAGKLVPLIDPRLAGLAWYLFGDPATSPPVLEMAYLNGVTEPFLDSQDGWRVDGTEYKVRHDFGGGFVDWKGGYKNPGAALVG